MGYVRELFCWLGSNAKEIIRGLFKFAQKLEKFTILELPPQIVSKIVNVVVAVAKMDVRVKQIDKILGEITAKRTS